MWRPSALNASTSAKPAIGTCPARASAAANPAARTTMVVVTAIPANHPRAGRTHPTVAGLGPEVNCGHGAASRARGRAEPGVRVAVPAPAELRPAVADPERRHPLVAAPRAGHGEAPVRRDDLRLLEHERDALVERERGAARGEDVAQRGLGADVAAARAEVDVVDDVGGRVGQLHRRDRRERVEVRVVQVAEHEGLARGAGSARRPRPRARRRASGRPPCARWGASCQPCG